MTERTAVGVFGARGTGKTTWVIQHLKAIKAPRLIVWDFKNDPVLDTIAKPEPDLYDFIMAMRAPRFRLRYQVNHDKDIQAQFDLFCRAAWSASDLTMFVDELPAVTAANRAPPSWRKCVNIGREYRTESGAVSGLSIIGAGQRAAECDKSFLSNLDTLHCGRMTNPADAAALAPLLGVSAAELATLPNFAYIERRAGHTEPIRGTLGKKSFRAKADA